MEEENNNGKFVRWQVFVWTVGIFSALMLSLFIMMNTAISASQENRIDIRELQTLLTAKLDVMAEDINEIKTDIKIGLIDHIKD